MEHRSDRGERGVGRGGRGMDNSRISNEHHGSSSSRRRQLPFTYREDPPKDGGGHWRHGEMPPAGADDHGVGSRARRRLDGGGWAEGGGSRGRFVEGSRGLGVGGSGGMRHVGGGGNEIGPERGRRVSSPRRDWNREGGRDSREMPRPVVIEPSHVPAIGGRGWERSPLRNGYRGGGADIEVGSGGGGADRGAPRYSNGVESGGGW
ncbi:unnamed protein product, partial [Ascophyllum nodosum]